MGLWEKKMEIRNLVILFLLLFVGCNSNIYKCRLHDLDEDLLLEYHNDARKTDLVIDEELRDAAFNHAIKMATTGRLKHQKLKFDSNWRMLGENIAQGQIDEEEVFDDWMNSKGHRRNILNENFDRVGFGCSINEKDEIYWCVVFGQSPTPTLD